MSNVVDITTKRRLRNMERSLNEMQEQLNDIKAAIKILQKHREFRFFSIMCHELDEKRKIMLQDIIALKLRMDKYKDLSEDEINE